MLRVPKENEKTMPLNPHRFKGEGTEAVRFYQGLSAVAPKPWVRAKASRPPSMPTRRRTKILATELEVGGRMFMGAGWTAVRGPKGFSVTLETPTLPEVVRVFSRLADDERLRMPVPREVPGILVEDACRPLWPSMDGERQGQLRTKSLCHR